MRNLPPKTLGKTIQVCKDMDVPEEFKQFEGRQFYWSRDLSGDWVSFCDTRHHRWKTVGRGETDKEAILNLYFATVNPMRSKQIA